MVLEIWSWVLGLRALGANLIKTKDLSPKTYSIDIRSAAAVAHGAKITASTVIAASK